ncbi:MAG: hypothetical protein O7G84_10745 [Gammaproteobacteria bacterium]|nr:hypothetical protein [Gammaproteobacteria bacterium]
MSEESGIELFEPRPAKEGKSYVWSVGESRLQNYMFPRDCPRVTFYASDGTSEQDRRELLGNTSADFVLAIEQQWLPAMIDTPLHVYELDPDPFALFLYDEIAGYYVSEQAARPVGCRVVTNPLAELMSFNVEFRVLPSLWELREAVIHSSVGFSIIRFRNAAAPPEGTEQRFSPR